MVIMSVAYFEMVQKECVLHMYMHDKTNVKMCYLKTLGEGIEEFIVLVL